jgi:AraC family transcriptional regulator
LRISERTRPATALTYVQRINLAIDHIVDHLDEPLRLRDVARVARLSRFHFHRIFQALLGSTPADFVQRLRLEKALRLLSYPRPPALTAIALRCGFSSSSDFSRCFKRRFGVPPSSFDLNGWRRTHGAELEAIVAETAARPRVERLPPRHNPNSFRVRVRQLGARTVAYIRVDRPYEGNRTIKAVLRLLAWAERNGVADHQWIGYQWENPEITSLENCRYYAAVEAERFTPHGEVGRYRFGPMTVAEVAIHGGLDLVLCAWQWLYGSWLPRSGFVPDDQPAFEAWLGRPFAHGMDHFAVALQLPIRRA